MAEFSKVDLVDDAPVEICPRCARRAVTHEPTQTAIAHCVHTLCGAYRPVGREWQVVRGVEASTFRDLVLRGLTLGELRVDLERDLSRIVAEQQAQRATKH